jgi:hypothetical protein
MFDFRKWERGVSAKADALCATGCEVEFQAATEESEKPSFVVALIGTRTVADFQTWKTGETDWTVLDKGNPVNAMLAHRWGLKLDDGSYEAAFEEFLAAVLKCEAPPSRAKEKG